jgi:pyruvate kinase
MALSKEGKAAILATIGPASSDPEIFAQLIDAGLDIVRLNMSHGTHEDHRKRFEMVRSVDDTIPILFDLSGPKIRVGEMEEPVNLRVGDEIIMTKKQMIGNAGKVSVSYPDLIDQAGIGNTLFLNDGLIQLSIVEKTKTQIKCEVVAGGPLSSRKGVNAPGVPIKLFAPTEKDLKDISFTIDLEPDFYGVSFVRRGRDLQKVRDHIANFTTETVPLISKIEHQDALDNIDEVITMSDAVMVARGDLGVELPPEDIPLIQERLVKQCNDLAKPVIVATQMLESMVMSSKPTRAEASDVANAILQGADAVMLSAESATGNYPVESVLMMEKIVRRVQSKVQNKASDGNISQNNIAESVGKSAVSLASALEADVIMAFTRSGGSAGSVAKFRPSQPIIAVTPQPKTARRSRLLWGVQPLLLSRDFVDTDEMIFEGVRVAHEHGLVDKFDSAVLVAGSLLGLPSSTNLIHYVKIDEIINSVGASKRFAKVYSLQAGIVNK